MMSADEAALIMRLKAEEGMARRGVGLCLSFIVEDDGNDHCCVAMGAWRADTWIPLFIFGRSPPVAHLYK